MIAILYSFFIGVCLIVSYAALILLSTNWADSIQHRKE